MRVLFATIGSTGDIRPFIWMARTLERRGHHATLLAPAYFAPMIESYGVRCRPVPIEMDPKQITERPACMSRFKGTGVVLKEMLFPHYPAIFEQTVRAIEEESPDILLHHQIMLASAWGAERAGIPTGCVSLAPTSWPSHADPNRYPMMPDRDRYRPWLVSLGMAAAHVAASRMFDPSLNRMRAEVGLPRQRRIITQASLDARLNLGMWSRAFRGPAVDDPRNAHIIGFPFLDDPDDAWERVDERIKAFLSEGTPPVLITLGSTASLLPGGLHDMLAAWCRLVGRRAIVLAPDLNAPEASDDVLVVPPDPQHTPHAGIMPRCAATFVHGGIGTTAEALRAGCPLVIVPHAHDQFDNARRVRLLGAGVVRSRSSDRAPFDDAALWRCAEGARRASAAIREADADMDVRFVGAIESLVTPRATRSDPATSADPSSAAAGCATG